MTDIIERLSDEADQCRNDGADDIAGLLDDAGAELARLRAEVESLRADKAMLDHLDSLGYLWGHPGSECPDGKRWEVEGPYSSVRELLADELAGIAAITKTKGATC